LHSRELKRQSVKAEYLTSQANNEKNVCGINVVDSYKKRNKVVDKRDWEVAMHKIRRLRAMGSLCRQQAAYNPAQSWKLLAEAEYWEHMAAAETSSHFEDCNTNRSSDLAKVRAAPNANDTRWKTIVAA